LRSNNSEEANCDYSGLSEQAAHFVSRRSTATILPCFVEARKELSDLYWHISKQVADGLAVEFAPMTPAKRLLVEVAKNAFTDSILFSRAARAHVEKASKGDPDTTARIAERYSKMVERSSKLVLSSVDALRRPGPSTVSIKVRDGGNVNFGTQKVKPESLLSPRGKNRKSQ
jgi:hypothetical protein